MFGAECGGGELALKNNFGIKRNALPENGFGLSIAPGKFALRLSIPPKNRPRSALLLKVTVAAVDGGPIVEIGNDQDIGLVITRSGFDPSFPLAHVIR